MGIEHLDNLGKVEQGAGKPIDLVDDYNIDFRAADVSQKPLQSWPLQSPTRIAAIVILGWQRDPAFMLLTGNFTLAS
jgi:hypothetical protein